MEFVARSKVQGVFFCDDMFFTTIIFCDGVIVLVGQATKEWETRCVWCDGVFFATVCFLATMCFLRRCVFQRRGLCCEYMVVYFATGTGVVSFGGRMFFATLCFLRRSVGVFCVDQKCFLHRDSVFFASPTNVWDQSRKLPLGPPLLLALASPTCTKIFRQWGLALRTPRGRRCALPHTPLPLF